MNQENIFDGGYSFMSTPCSISYLFNNKSVHTYALHIFSLSIYPMKLHEFFFFLQALAGIFFSSSIPCMNFFFGSDTPPPPRISNGPPLNISGDRALIPRQSKCVRENMAAFCQKYVIFTSHFYGHDH